MTETATHVERLMKMADFTRSLLEVARRYNGPQPHWEAERLAEVEALEAGAEALVFGELLVQKAREEG